MFQSRIWTFRLRNVNKYTYQRTKDFLSYPCMFLYHKKQLIRLLYPRSMPGLFRILNDSPVDILILEGPRAQRKRDQPFLRIFRFPTSNAIRLKPTWGSCWSCSQFMKLHKREALKDKIIFSLQRITRTHNSGNDSLRISISALFFSLSWLSLKLYNALRFPKSSNVPIIKCHSNFIRRLLYLDPLSSIEKGLAEEEHVNSETAREIIWFGANSIWRQKHLFFRRDRETEIIMAPTPLNTMRPSPLCTALKVVIGRNP